MDHSGYVGDELSYLLGDIENPICWRKLDDEHPVHFGRNSVSFCSCLNIKIEFREYSNYIQYIE